MWKTGFAHSIGGRPYMEDYGVSVTGKDFCLMSVFDGHGGSKIAEECRNTIGKNFFKTLQVPQSIDYLEELYENLRRVVDDMPKDVLDSSGTTCTLLLLTDTHAYCLNVGDSSALMIYNDDSMRFLTTSDRPEVNIDDVKRIRSMGGIVFALERGGCLRVLGDLNMTRSLGDKRLKPFVIDEPHCRTVELLNAKVTVVASDGLWDFVSSASVREIIMLNWDENEFNIARHLVVAALNAGQSRADNVYVTVCRLRLL
jgi:serine/threonine protein phosphatase PrpC